MKQFSNSTIAMSMKLPIPQILGKREKPEYLLALLLRDEKVTAVVFRELQGKITVVGQHEEYFQTRLQEAPLDEWFDVLDKAISRAEETLPANVETHKTVFGVKDEWVEEKKIRKEYLATLKKVCDALSLTPIGFLVISEAITHLMQEEEGAPISALLAQIGRKSVSISLVRAGRVIETKITDLIDDSPVTTVDTVLKHFTDVEVLPSRLIIFNGKGEELAQDFISHQWSKSLPFLHVPQISVLPPGFDHRAVVFGAAEQMGFDVLGSEVDKTVTEIKTFVDKKGKMVKEEVIEESKETNETEETPQTVTAADAASFGFVVDEEISQSGKEGMESPEEEREVEHEEKPTAHKIISHKAHLDHEATHAIAMNEHDNLREPSQTRHEPRLTREESAEPPPSQRRAKEDREGKRFSGTGIISMIAGTLASMTTQGIRVSGGLIGRGGKLMLIAPAVILLIVGLILLYIFQLRATVTLDVTPKPISEEETITFSLTSDNDFAQNTLSAKSIAVDLSGKVKTQTTGKKEIGDKAKGTVTLFNSSDSKKNLSEGTKITSSNNLEFTLDKDVTIGSASGDIFSGIKSGTAQVAVTASKIGKEYNLPSNTKFTVGGNSSLAAKNENAFSGGSKKEVTVVSKKDIAKLEEELPKSLQGKAKEEIGKKISGDEETLPVFSDATLAKKKFDKEEGKEAKSVTLSATVSFTYFTYAKSDLQEYAASVVKNRFTDEGNVSQNGITNTLSDVKQKDEKEVEAKVKITGGLMPKLDTSSLQEELTGKSFIEAKELLAKQPQVDNVDITLTPPIPFLPQMLPRISKNITIVIHSNE